MVFEVNTGAASTCGTTAFDADDATELPAELFAFTVNVYEVPCVKPAMEMVPEEEPTKVPVILLGLDVAV